MYQPIGLAIRYATTSLSFEHYQVARMINLYRNILDRTYKDYKAGLLSSDEMVEWVNSDDGDTIFRLAYVDKDNILLPMILQDDEKVYSFNEMY